MSNRRFGSNTLSPARVRSDGTATQEDPNDRMRQRVRQNTAYEKYKSSLNAYFDGNQPLPEQITNILHTRPGAEDLLDEEIEVAAHEDAPKKKKNTKNKLRAPKDSDRRERRILSRSPDSYRSLLNELEAANSPREIAIAVDAMRSAGHELPDDLKILSKVLGHSDEDVIADALQGLLRVLEEGPIQSPRLLITRVDNVALLASSSEVRALCAKLKAKLG